MFNEEIGRPIFLHSLFRTGSTYFFTLFRRTGCYWCYQEPLHEQLNNLNTNPDALLTFSNDEAIKLRHPVLDKPYFWEFYEIKDVLKGLFKKNFSYDDYFIDAENINLPDDQVAYFTTLISEARGIPMLQLCRSSGRANAMKRSLGGVHLHLWREPRSQWWSYKTIDYFDITTHLIYNSNNLPEILQAIKDCCGIAPFHGDAVRAELFFAKTHPLNFRQSYFAFYALWLYSRLALQRVADVEISVDRLVHDMNYHQRIMDQLCKIGIQGIDLSECNMPIMLLSGEELDFYRGTEAQVRELFRQYGYVADALDGVQTAIVNDNQLSPHHLMKNGKALRDIVERLSNELVDAEVRANALDTKLQSLYESLAWKISMPLRVIRRWILRL